MSFQAPRSLALTSGIMSAATSAPAVPEFITIKTDPDTADIEYLHVGGSLPDGKPGFMYMTTDAAAVALAAARERQPHRLVVRRRGRVVLNRVAADARSAMGICRRHIERHGMAGIESMEIRAA